MNDRAKISVGVITYNQESTIRQTLDSILAQKGDFDLELVSGEDCSPDGTFAICADYAEHYPDVVKLLPNTKNLGIMANFARVMKACSGDYIGMCAGDDYWCDELKLQKQIDFMDAHPEYSICFHNFENYDVRQQKLFPSCEKAWYKKSEGKSEYGTDIVITDYFNRIGQPLTMMFRVSMFDFDAHNRYKYYRDTHEIYHLLTAGKGYWMNFVEGVYHKHEGGISSGVGLDQHCWEERVHILELYLKNRYDKVLRAYLIEILLWNYNVFKREGRTKEYWSIINAYWKEIPTVLLSVYWVIFKRNIKRTC